VGDLDAARSYVAEALPLNSGPPRIARVVLLSAAAGVALADGDYAAAADYGSTADREATELGVEREVPLIRAVLARALLAQGEAGLAAGPAAGALRAALGMTVESPLAVGLETAALVLRAAAGGSLPDAAAGLLAAAAVIRARGDRPSPVLLAAAVARLSDELTAAAGGPAAGDPGTGPPRDGQLSTGQLSARAAAEQACRLLAALPGVRRSGESERLGRRLGADA
jgi:hypothetical protein